MMQRYHEGIKEIYLHERHRGTFDETNYSGDTNCFDQSLTFLFKISLLRGYFWQHISDSWMINYLREMKNVSHIKKHFNIRVT